MEDKLYFIYKTTNIKNDKFYIGVHETYNLEDGYLGSGKKFKNSLYYHGKENFKREILEYFDNSKSMYNREEVVVNEELLKNPKCLNLKIGGFGGFISKQNQRKRSIAGAKAFVKKLRTDLNFKEAHRKIVSKNMKEAHRIGKIKYDTFSGKTHSIETKIQMSESKKGTGMGFNNSQYGTCWITNEKINKKIYKGDEIPKGFRLGRI